MSPDEAREFLKAYSPAILRIEPDLDDPSVLRQASAVARAMRRSYTAAQLAQLVPTDVLDDALHAHLSCNPLG